MDIKSIEKITTRKRLVEDLSNVQGKIQKENVELIKLQLAQDSAYWGLKEKLSLQQGEHERLQQNMVQLQMQHEELSARLQDELRHRAETLNKLNASRKICSVLETAQKQCKERSTLASANLAALSDVYGKADQLVCQLQQDHDAGKEKYEREIHGLMEKLKLMGVHQQQLYQAYSEWQRRADAEVAELKNEVKDKQTLAATVSELKQDLLTAKNDIDKRDATIAALHRDMSNTVADLRNQLVNTQNLVAAKENTSTDLRKQLDDKQSRITVQENELTELRSQLAYTQNFLTANENAVADLRNHLADTQSLVTEKDNTVADLRTQLADTQNIVAVKETELDDLRGQIVYTQNVVTVKEKEMADLRSQLADTQNVVTAKENEVVDLRSELADTKNLVAAEANTVADLRKQLADTQNLVIAKENDMADLSKQLADAQNLITDKENELSLAREQLHAAVADYDHCKTELEEARNMNSEKQNDIAKLKDENDIQQKQKKELQEVISVYDKEIERFRSMLMDSAATADRLSLELRETAAQRDAHADRVQQLEAQLETLSKNLNDTEIASAEYRAAAEDKIKKNLEIIEEKNNELDIKKSAIVQAMADFEKEKEKRELLQKELQAIEKEMEQERKENKRKQAQWEMTIKSKDEALSREMSKFLQVRSELENDKCALQKKIDELQIRISNIMKEAGDVGAPRCSLAPEPDKSPAVLTPQRAGLFQETLSPPFSPLQPQPLTASIQNLIFDFRSEDSMDCLNPQHLKEKRHFGMFARQPEPAPASTLSLKRTHAGSTQEGNRAQRPRDDTPVKGKSTQLPKQTVAPKEKRFFKTRQPLKPKNNK